LVGADAPQAPFTVVSNGTHAYSISSDGSKIRDFSLSGSGTVSDLYDVSAGLSGTVPNVVGAITIRGPAGILFIYQNGTDWYVERLTTGGSAITGWLIVSGGSAHADSVHGDWDNNQFWVSFFDGAAQVAQQMDLSGSILTGPFTPPNASPVQHLRHDIRGVEAYMPAGTVLAFGGFGDGGVMRYASLASGTVLNQPPVGDPQPGTGLEQIATSIPYGYLAQIGGNDPPFSSGAGIWNAIDLSKGGEIDFNDQDGWALAVDGNGYFYTAKYPFGGHTVNIYKIDNTGATVQTWAINLPAATYDVTRVPLGISEDGLTAYYWLSTKSGDPDHGKYRVHEFDLSGAGVDNGIFTTDYNGGNSGVGPILLPHDGSGDVIIGFDRYNTLTFANEGALIRYNSAGVAQHTYFGIGDGKFPLFMAHGADPATTFIVNSYDAAAATYSGVTVQEISVATGADVITPFQPEDGSYEFDSQIALLRIAYGTPPSPPPTPNPVPNPTPPAPQTPCSPQTQTTNGGKGQSGCNTGGVGWTRTYFGPWGRPDDHAEATYGETMDNARNRGVEVWTELVDPLGTHTTIKQAMIPLADPSDYKSDGLRAMGSVEHALGNEQNGFEAATVDVQYRDRPIDRVYRNLLASSQIEGDELYVKAGSDALREAGGEPRVLMRGIVQKPKLQSTMKFSLSAVDRLFSDTGPFGPGKKYPAHTYGELGTAAPQMTSDTRETVISALYGEVSDDGATDPIFGGPNAKGLIPGTFLGMFTISGAAGAPSSAAGKTLAQVVAELQASVTAGTTDADWGDVIGHADAATLQALGTVPDTYVRLADVIGYADLDFLMSQGTTPVVNAGEYGILAFGLGPWWRWNSVWASDLQGGDPTAKPSRVSIDLASRSGVGGELLVPGWNDCPFLWMDFTNEAGKTFRLAVIGVRGPLLDAHLKGEITIAANGIGLEHIGDGTGLPVGLMHDAEQHWLENFVMLDKTSGPWCTDADAPKYNDGTYIVKSSSFRTRQTFTQTSMGDANGLLIGWYPDEADDVTSWIEKWMEWTESRTGITSMGQVMKWGLDRTIDPTDWTPLEHVTDFYNGITITYGEDRENTVVGRCDFDPDLDKFRFGPITQTDAVAVTSFKNRVKKGDEMQNQMLRDQGMLQWVMGQRLLRLANGMTLVDVTGPMDWLDLEIGDGVLLTSEDGPGDGYVRQPMAVLRQSFDLGNRKVTLTLWDMYTLLLATATGGDVTESRLSAVTDTDADATIVTDDESLAPLVLL
jgi:hypothetical protein